MNQAYDDLMSALRGHFAAERDRIANAANCAAAIWRHVPELNWAGFYFSCDGGLVLGPFQGNPAVTRIAAGRGVCGAAAARRQTIVIDDVHAFADHIVCDGASNSEIVVPLLRDGLLLGVLDLDSPRRARFEAADRAGLEAVAAAWVAACD